MLGQMTRDELTLWLKAHREVGRVQRDLEIREAADPASSVAISLSLIAAMRATIPQAAIESQRAADDERVRETWNRLRRSLRA